MFKKLKFTLALLLLLASTHLSAQDASQTSKEPVKIPGSILRVGYSPINLFQGAILEPGITFDFEKPLSPRFTLGASLNHDFTPKSNTYDELFDRENEFNNIRSSLSFSFNYYLKPYAYDGFYISYRANNAIARVTTGNGWNPFNGLEGEVDTRIISRPRRGLYLGYRKVFNKGVFVDASAGVVTGNVRSDNLALVNNWFDVRFTIGWQIGWRKDKKRRKK